VAALVGDRYHNSDYIRVSLGKTLSSGLNLHIDFCDEVKMLNAEELQGYQLLIILHCPTIHSPYGQGTTSSSQAKGALYSQSRVRQPWSMR
jgi:hypothetical protein